MSNVGKRGKLSLETRLRDADLNGTNTRLQHHEIKRVREAIASARKAPAEGAGELKNLHRLASQEADHLEREAEEADDNNWQDWAVTMRQGADYIRKLIRARSSAPEGEEALGNLLAVIHGDGGHRALEVGTKQAALEAEKIVANLLSSAPEAREGLKPQVRPMEDTLSAFDVMKDHFVGTSSRPVPHPAAPSADKLREVLRDLMDMEFAKDWRTWSEDRATRLLGIGPRLNAFLAAREAALKAEGA